MLKESLTSFTSLDIRVHINRCINIGFLAILQLDAVSVAIIPKFNDFSIDELSNVSFDLIAHLETELRSHKACFKASFQHLMVEVPTNEHEDVLSLRSMAKVQKNAQSESKMHRRAANISRGISHSLRHRPFLIRNISIEEHAYSLEDEFLIDAFKRQNALVPEEIGTIL